MLVGLAEEESKTRSDRLKAKNAQAAKQGKAKGGGTRPFGFEDDRVTHRADEAEMVREAGARVIAGDTLRTIRKDWTDRSIPTVTGKPWSSTVLRNMLTSPRVAGLQEHLGEIVRDDNGGLVKAPWESIIDEATYFRLLEVLLDPARNKSGGRPGRVYLLTGGLARCGLCGSKLVARPRGDRQPCYVCASDNGGCGKIRQLAHPFEEHVLSTLYGSLDLIEQANHSPIESGDTAEQIEDALRADQEALEALSRDYYVDRILSRDEFMAARPVLMHRIDQMQHRLLELQQAAPPSFSELLIRAVELDLNDPGQIGAWKVVAVRALEKVAVHPAVRGRNRFDPNRIEIVWKDAVADLIWSRSDELAKEPIPA